MARGAGGRSGPRRSCRTAAARATGPARDRRRDPRRAHHAPRGATTPASKPLPPDQRPARRRSRRSSGSSTAFGALWALGLVVLAALVARRWRLARDLADRAASRRGSLGSLDRCRSSSSNASLMHALDVVTRVGRRHPVVPRRATRGDRRGDLGGVAVPHPAGPAPRAAARAPHGDRVALPRHRAARRRARGGRARLGRRRRRAPGLRLARWPADDAPRCAAALDELGRRRPDVRLAAPPTEHRHRDGRERRRASSLVRVLGPRRSRRAADRRRSGARSSYKDGGPERPPHPARGRRARGVRAAPRRTSRACTFRRSSWRAPPARARRSLVIRPPTGRVLADVDPATSPTPCSTTSGGRSPRCTRHASRTAR